MASCVSVATTSGNRTINLQCGGGTVCCNKINCIITKHSLSFSSSSSSWSSVSAKSNTNRSRGARRQRQQRAVVVVIRAASENMATEKLGIKILNNPPESKLSELGVRQWPKWGCPPSKFPWTYTSKETCYLLEGKVKVYPDGSDEAVEIGAGDFVVFPKGMSCTWDVSVAVDKHYKFE